MKARDNPFSSDRVLRVRYRPQGETWDDILRRLSTLHYRAALVGPHGTGKTTLLEDLAPHLAAQGFSIRQAFLNEDTPLAAKTIDQVLTNLTPRDILLLDGADHLPWWTWRRFRRHTANAGGLIITSHREGMLPTLVRTQTSEPLLREIVAELLGDRAAEVAPRLPALLAAHHGNLREAIRELYDLYASL